MRRFPVLIALATSVALSLCLNCQAQSGSSSARTRVVPGLRSPFSLDGVQNGSPFVAFRSADQMSRQDQDLLANAQATIQEKAGFENLDFNQSGWEYQQIACAAFPDHLFLRFSRDDGSRQSSMFSVAIPRGAEGKVRIIPIVRKGYSLFSPAPINSLTIAAFNQIRASEAHDKAPDWVGTGLCYVALTGGDPGVTAPEPTENVDPVVPVTAPPRLELRFDGDVLIRFVARGAGSRMMLWSMTFDRTGRLLKAQHSPAPEMKIRLVSSAASQPRTHQIPSGESADK